MSDLPYSRVLVTGHDAFDFLQAQLATDVAAFNADAAQLSAWLNPKGRVVCLFRGLRSGDRFELVVASELAQDVITRMLTFRFRAKVEFELDAASSRQLGIESGLDQWRLDNLRAGIPEIGLAQSGRWTPHMLNLDLLGAVAVDKGCYPGQEVVSRTHFRGKTKRRCLYFKCDVAVAVGDKVCEADSEVGEVLNAIGNELLAVVPLEHRAAALTVAGRPLIQRPLPYL